MIVVFGVSGVIGRAAAVRFAASGRDVLGVSRRSPGPLRGVEHLALDLTDGAACAAALGELRGVTHVVYAAMVEAPGLVPGWRDTELMGTNLAMFDHAVAPLAAAGDLQHVSLLQGTKAYGVHLGGPVPVPVKERLARHPHDNFYFLQEDRLRELSATAGFDWTVLRPQVVYGRSLGSPMNLIPAIGAYAAVMADLGRPFSFPGGADRVSEAVDADLLAEALAWAATSPAAAGQTFNVTNGDVFVWRQVWPAIAHSLDVEVGPDEPRSLAAEMSSHADRWASIVDRHALVAPRDLDAFVGQSFVYADMLFGHGQQHVTLPVLSSTVKLRQAGFGACRDSEDMFVSWFGRFRQERLLP